LDVTTIDLELEIDDHSDTELEGFFLPLLRCAKLQDSKIHSHLDLCASLTDSDIDLMARTSWSDLKRLELTSIIAWRPDLELSPLTMDSVFSLGTLCRELESIILTLDLQKISIPVSVVATVHNLKICFWNSSVDDPVQLASALLGIVQSDRVSWSEGQGPFEEEEEAESKLRDTVWKCALSCLEALQNLKIKEAALRQGSRIRLRPRDKRWRVRSQRCASRTAV
jgi:hypothetical protein